MSNVGQRSVESYYFYRLLLPLNECASFKFQVNSMIVHKKDVIASRKTLHLRVDMTIFMMTKLTVIKQLSPNKRTLVWAPFEFNRFHSRKSNNYQIDLTKESFNFKEERKAIDFMIYLSEAQDVDVARKIKLFVDNFFSLSLSLVN